MLSIQTPVEEIEKLIKHEFQLCYALRVHSYVAKRMIVGDEQVTIKISN